MIRLAQIVSIGPKTSVAVCKQFAAAHTKMEKEN